MKLRDPNSADSFSIDFSTTNHPNSQPDNNNNNNVIYPGSSHHQRCYSVRPCQKKKKNVKFERLKIVKNTILKCSIKLHYKMS